MDHKQAAAATTTDCKALSFGTIHSHISLHHVALNQRPSRNIEVDLFSAFNAGLITGAWMPTAIQPHFAGYHLSSIHIRICYRLRSLLGYLPKTILINPLPPWGPPSTASSRMYAATGWFPKPKTAREISRRLHYRSHQAWLMTTSSEAACPSILPSTSRHSFEQA